MLRALLTYANFNQYYCTRTDCRSYVRRYLDPANLLTPNPPFDVITEMWFPDWATQKACMAHLSDPVIASEIQADEAKLFDPGAKWGGFLTEEVSVMPPV